MATAGLVLGIIAIVLDAIGWFAGVGGILAASQTSGQAQIDNAAVGVLGIVMCFFAFFIALVGVILSLVATLKKGNVKKGKAIAGLILSGIVLIVTLIVIIIALSNK